MGLLIALLVRHPGFVVGMAAEAKLAKRFGAPVVVSGGTPDGATDAARRLVADGVDALVSFGLAGGLDPALRPGDVIIPELVLVGDQDYATDADLAGQFGGLTGHRLFAGTAIVPDAAAKRQLRRTSLAHAVDLESGAVAKIARTDRLPFIVVRAICDPAERTLPPAALLALDQLGNIVLKRVLMSLLRQPRQLPDMLRLARDATFARRSLAKLVKGYQAPPADPACSGAHDPGG